MIPSPPPKILPKSASRGTGAVFMTKTFFALSSVQSPLSGNGEISGLVWGLGAGRGARIRFSHSPRPPKYSCTRILPKMTLVKCA